MSFFLNLIFLYFRAFILIFIRIEPHCIPEYCTLLMSGYRLRGIRLYIICIFKNEIQLTHNAHLQMHENPAVLRVRKTWNERGTIIACSNPINNVSGPGNIRKNSIHHRRCDAAYCLAEGNLHISQP